MAGKAMKVCLFHRNGPVDSAPCGHPGAAAALSHLRDHSGVRVQDSHTAGARVRVA